MSLIKRIAGLVRRPTADPIKSAGNYKKVQELAKESPLTEKMKQLYTAGIASAVVGVTGVSAGLPPQIAVPVVLGGAAIGTVKANNRKEQQAEEFRALKSSIELFIPKDLLTQESQLREKIEIGNNGLNKIISEIRILLEEIGYTYKGFDPRSTSIETVKVSLPYHSEKMKEIFPKLEALMSDRDSRENDLNEVSIALRKIEEEINRIGNEVYLSGGQEVRAALKRGDMGQVKRLIEANEELNVNGLMGAEKVNKQLTSKDL